MLWNARVSKTSAQDESWGMKDESWRMKEVLVVGILLHFKGGIERKSLDQWRGPTIYEEDFFLNDLSLKQIQHKEPDFLFPKRPCINETRICILEEVAIWAYSKVQT